MSSATSIVETLGKEQKHLLASFSQAIGNVGSDRGKAQNLHASLAVALSLLTATAANAIVSVGTGHGGDFGAKAAELRTRVGERLKHFLHGK